MRFMRCVVAVFATVRGWLNGDAADADGLIVRSWEPGGEEVGRENQHKSHDREDRKAKNGL